MGKKRAGKKAWKRIDTQEVDDFLEKSTREERQGLVVEGVPDADLFFVDKAGDEGAADAAAAALAGRTSRKLAARQKVLRSAAILAAAHSAIPVAKPPPRKPKGSVLQQQQQQQQQKGTAVAGGKGGGRKRGGAWAAVGGGEGALDIWGERGQAALEQQEGADPAFGSDGWMGNLPNGAPPAKKPKRGRGRPAAAAAAVARGGLPGVPAVPAVEIDPAGCSYNPDAEQHQEAVAAAVAVETRKLLDKELAPVAPPKVVDYQPETDELALLQTLEGAVGEEEDEEEEAAEEEEGADYGGIEAARRKQEAARKSKRDRNKELRRREAEEELAQQRKLKAQRRELSSLKDVQRQVEEEEAAKEDARLRRQLDKAERMAAEPPKLSKHKFQAMPLQVLTSDELAGSLRRLKPTAMLAKDRFKSLQKRALVEPRRRIEHKKQGKKIEYVHGERAERAAERHAELQELKKARKQAKKAQKGGQ